MEADLIMEHDIGTGYKIHLDEPVIVSMAAPGETRWGRHQFVRLSRYPEDKILLRFHAGADSVTAYGEDEPAFLSADSGHTWTPYEGEGFSATGSSFAVFNDEFLCVPHAVPFNVKAAGLNLPEPVGTFFSYRQVNLYRADQCAEAIQTHLNRQVCTRWHPETAEWVNEYLSWDSRHRLVWIAQGEEADRVSGTWTEHAPIQLDGELLYTDYRASYLMDNESVPQGCGVACMVSMDNGRTWQKRATIVGPNGIPGSVSNMTEPVLALDVNKNLVCVIRRADQEQKSLLITFSKDKGQTWEGLRPLEELGPIGVFPSLVSLDCGLLGLSYGRPGVHLTFSLDGTGHSWVKPITILPGDRDLLSTKTDGYTDLIPIGPDEFLLAYTDFETKDEMGRHRKAVLVRRVWISRSTGGVI